MAEGVIFIENRPPFQLPPSANTLFHRWAIAWCIFCEADWTVIVADDDYDAFLDLHPLLNEALFDHGIDCPSRPPIHDPEGLATWLES